MDYVNEWMNEWINEWMNEWINCRNKSDNWIVMNNIEGIVESKQMSDRQW